MKKVKFFILTAAFIAAMIVVGNLSTLSALDSEGDPSQTYQPDGIEGGSLPLAQVEVVEMPAVDNEALIQQDIRSYTPGTPNRFAIPFDVQITPYSHGDWEKLSNGDWLWRLRILSPDAKSLNLGFTTFRLPAGGELTLYTPDYQIIRGPFTAADNDAHGEFWTPILEQNEVVLQLTVPTDFRNEVQLELTAVNHGYQDLKEANAIQSGACNVDVVCPEGDPWRDQIRSSGVYTVGGVWTCSGALVNNTAQDMTPYFLTADHCSVSSGNAASVVVYWNYENSTCRTPGSPASGQPGDGSLDQFNSGAIFRADYGLSDMTLIELDDPIDDAVDPYFSGWDATSGDEPGAIAIHHPNTDEKRISFENDPTSTTSYLGTSVPGDGTHVRVTDWDLGTTEPGSSGSPLYNPEFRIIGQLHGGYAACGNDESDWYGRFDISWSGGGTAATRLSDWLDPLNTGDTVLDGRGLNTTPDFELTTEPTSQSVCIPETTTFNVAVASLFDYTDSVTLSTTGVPTGYTAGFDINSQPAPFSSTLILTGTASAMAGSYDIEIAGIAPTSTHTTTIQLILNDGVPGTTTLIAPANNASNVDPLPTFEWTAVSGASEYVLEVATDISFSNIVYSTTTSSISHTMSDTALTTNTNHFWRVRTSNGCGETTSITFSFMTTPAPGDCSPGTSPVYAFEEDFETGSTGWTTGGTNNTWVLSTNRPHSGSYAFHAEDVNSISDQYLVTPEIALPTGQLPLTLQFWNHQTIEDDSGTACFDGAILEISTNGGSSWTQLDSELLTDPYDGFVDTDYSNPLAGLNAWCGDPQDWLNSIVDIDAYAGQSVQFRFRLGTDSSVGREGWYIDDVVVQSCEPASGEANIDMFPTSMSQEQMVNTIVSQTLTISNTGTANLDWYVTEATDNNCATPGDLDWVSASPNAGATISNTHSLVNVVFDATGMSQGTHSGSLCLVSNDPDSPIVPVPTSLHVNWYENFLPAILKP